MRLLVCSAWLVVTLASARSGAAPLVCTVGDAEVVVKPGQLNATLGHIKQTLKKKGAHVLDLPTQARALRERLDQPYDDPCARYADILALKAAVDAMSLDGELLSDKLARIERWQRGASLTERERRDTRRWLNDAKSDLMRGKLPKANAQLNAALGVVLKNKDLWHLPHQLPEPDDTPATLPLPSVNDDEVKEACPALAKRSMGTRDDYLDLRRRLADLMNERALRLGDIKDGAELVTTAGTLLEQGAAWPAVRLLCAALTRMKSATVDVGLVSGRFQRVRTQRGATKLSKADDLQVSELVREASDHIAASRFTEAHAVLERLLVMLGAPPTPSTELP